MSIRHSQEKPADHRGPLPVTGYEESLQRHLHVQPPPSLGEAAPLLSFDRQRDVEIPWDRVLENVAADPRQSSLTPLKDYFERSWDLTGRALVTAPEDSVIQVTDGKPAYSTITFEPPRTPAPGKEQAEPTLVAVQTGIVIKDGYHRYHLCKPAAGQEITKNDLLKPDEYAVFWKEKLQEVELCFPTDEGLGAGYTRVEYVDLAPKFILDSWDQLHSYDQFEKDLQDELAGASKDLIKTALGAGMDLEQINRIQRSIVSLRLRKLRTRRRLERLAQQAADLGYFLALETQKDRKTADNPPQKLPDIEAGKLYKRSKLNLQWTTTISRVECGARRGARAVRSFFGIESPEPKRWQEKKTHSADVDDWGVVDVNDNALAEKVRELKKGHEVFVFDATERGYVSADGTSLRDVMRRCERDEAFRRRCAVFVPVIERALGGRQLVRGYYVFLAPFPGIVPVALPKLSIRESLSYRLAWQETQLGEVANSITLAPGESRAITVRRTYEREEAYSQKRTTLFDLQEAETADMATEMEREITKDKQVGFDYAASKTTEASAPLEGVKVSATSNQKVNYNRSLKSFSRSLTKAAKKASSSVNRSYKDEVTTDARQTTKIANYDEYTSTIKNINEGRTLNLLFYRLYNRYEAGLYLDDLRFLVTPSVEIIAGSGIHDSVAFDATQVDRLLEEFRGSRVPFDLNEADELRYLGSVIQEFTDLFVREYGVHSNVVKLPKAMLRLGDGPRNQDGERGGEEHGREGGTAQDPLDTARHDFEDGKRFLKEHLEDLELTGNVVQRQDLQILARGLYVDALVGAVPSTETYSERMREQAVALKRAEVAVAEAEAHYRESLAHHVRSGGNWIVGVMPYRERNSLSLALKCPLADGRWEVFLDGKKLCDVPPDQLGNYRIDLAVGDKSDCLDDDYLMHRHLEVRDCDTGVVVRPVEPNSR